MPKASRDTSPRTLARNMKRLFAIAAACCLLLSTLAVGEGFQATEYQISVEAPSGWEHDDKDHFGFVICDPQSQNKKRKFRIHFPSGGASTPKEQVELSLNTINKRREGKYPLERIQYEKPVTTRTGVEGYMAAHGFEGEADRPYLNHYYFKIPSGRIICVCVYLSGANKEEEEKLDNIILNTLQVLPQERKNG